MRADLDRSYAALYAQAQRTLFPDSAAASAGQTVLRPSSTWRRASSAGPVRRSYYALAGLDSSKFRSLPRAALQSAQSLQSDLRNEARDVGWRSSRLRSYQVEIHKKFSIALACIIFMVIGAPLGLALRRSGLAVIGAVALGIFMFYWVTLVQGEKLSERGFFPPWVGMWIANLIMSGVGVWLILYVVLDLGATPPLRDRLWDWLTAEDS
jgi:lipopolysaccharide export system permease protein